MVVGTAVSGRGIATSQVDFSDPRFVKTLGAEPVPGTLNVLLDEPLVFVVDEQEDFRVFHRLFIRGTLDGVGEVLIHRWRGAPLHVIEIVSTKRIKDVLGLKDRDPVALRVSSKRFSPVSVIQQLAHFLIWKWREDWYYKYDWYSNSGIVRYIRHHLSQ